MNEAIKKAQAIITAQNKTTVYTSFRHQWGLLNRSDKVRLEKWYKDEKIAEKVPDAPNVQQGEKKELNELILTPEQEALCIAEIDLLTQEKLS